MCKRQVTMNENRGDGSENLQPSALYSSNKVEKYEKFLNETLRCDLKKVLDARDRIYSDMSEYMQLRNTIEQMQECKLNKVKTQVDLGCNMYCQAVVPDASKIMVCVGFGFFVEFTLPEALKFIEKKCSHLTQAAMLLTTEASRIKAHIKLVLEGLRELQGLPDSTEDPRRTDIWV